MCQKLNVNSLKASAPSFELISEARPHFLSKKFNISTQASLLVIFALFISLINDGKFIKKFLSLF